MAAQKKLCLSCTSIFHLTKTEPQDVMLETESTPYTGTGTLVLDSLVSRTERDNLWFFTNHTILNIVLQEQEQTKTMGLELLWTWYRNVWILFRGSLGIQRSDGALVPSPGTADPGWVCSICCRYLIMTGRLFVGHLIYRRPSDKPRQGERWGKNVCMCFCVALCPAVHFEDKAHTIKLQVLSVFMTKKIQRGQKENLALKVLATKPNVLSSIPEPVWWKKWINSHKLSYDLYLHACVCTHKDR